MKRSDRDSDRPPRNGNGSRSSRRQFGSTKLGDDDGARIETDGYPPTDWQEHMNEARPEAPMPAISSDERSAGVVFNRRRGSY